MADCCFETNLVVKIGAKKPKDLPPELARALRTAEVTRKLEERSRFSLNFQAERYATEEGSPIDEYPLLGTDLLDPFNRVQITAQVGEAKQVLIDGFITHQDLGASSEGGTTITVKGEDISVKMDLFDVFAEHSEGEDPNKKGKKSSEIATQIIGKYQSLGLAASVTAPEGEVQPTKPRQQRETDRKYLLQLARDNACVFFVEPDDTAGENTAYWGPFKTEGEPQKALTINMGPADNLSSVNVSYDGLAPAITFGRFLDRTGDEEVEDIGAGTPSASAAPEYYDQPPIDSSLASLADKPEDFSSKLDKLDIRGRIFPPEFTVGSNEFGATDRAQSQTDRSIQRVVGANGSVDSSVYGAILKVRGCVDLRGVGKRYDGTYTVDEVTHKFSFDSEDVSYNQSFNLTRGGMGATISEVSAI